MIVSKNVPARLFAGAVLALGMLLLTASTASARFEVLRWTHPSPGDVAKFEALVATSPGVYGTPIPLGLPKPDAQGIYSASITVGDNQNVYVAVRAVDGNGQASLPSNERLRVAPTAPAPPPTAGGGDTPEDDVIARFAFDSGGTAGWLDTDAGNSMAQNDSLFSVVSVGGNSALSTQSSATNIHSHFVGNGSNMEDYAYTGRMLTKSAGGVGVTAYSQYPTSDTYYRLRAQGVGNRFEISGHPFPGGCGSIDTGVVAQANVWYEFELRVVNESSANRITATVWRVGDSKPGSPQAECLDSTSNRPRSGTIGVWSMGSGEKYWDELEVVSLSGASAGSGGSNSPIAPPNLISIQPVQ